MYIVFGVEDSDTTNTQACTLCITAQTWYAITQADKSTITLIPWVLMHHGPKVTCLHDVCTCERVWVRGIGSLSSISSTKVFGAVFTIWVRPESRHLASTRQCFRCEQYRSFGRLGAARPTLCRGTGLGRGISVCGPGGQAAFFTANQGATCSLFPGQNRAATDFPVNSGPSLFTIVASCSRRNFKGSR